jgi:tetratricopeptide (TPR) repeat protein
VTDRIIARALIQLDELSEAERLLRAQLASAPADPQTLRLLGHLRHLRGDDDPFAELRAAAHALGAAPGLRLTLADLLRRRGDLEAAEAELRQLLTQYGPLPELHNALAIVLQERGDWPQALANSRMALRAGEPSVAIAECFVVSCLGGGAAADALPLVERMRARFPRDQRWITHRIDLARLQGEEAFESWYAPSLVTQTFELADPGFLDTLRELLEAKHRHRGHPLDHSIRRGTQTPRNLLVDPEPPLVRLFEWFGDCLRRYLQRLSAEVPAAARDTHPVLARATSEPQPVGCWSVRLGRGGFHINHIHPEGWLSSAFYVQVPEEAADVVQKAGWLKFGEPGQATSILPPLGTVQPVPGRLVLFPSYLWHGTTPLARDATRLTVAFDAVPAKELL